MTKFLLPLLLCFCALVTQAGAFETARMELPEALAEHAERIPIAGFGGRNRGGYTLGPYSGDFTRIETRWAVADPFFAASRASSSFTIQGPGFDEPVSAECGMKKNTISVGVVTFDPKKMIYDCTFERAGLLMNWRFVLGQPRPENTKARFLAWAVRHGEAEINATRLTMRSVHKYAGRKIQSPLPAGYVIFVGEDPVGAIELTDVNPVLYLPQADVPERAAVILAAMAVAVLRDPADSALGDDP